MEITSNKGITNKMENRIFFEIQIWAVILIEVAGSMTPVTVSLLLQ